MNGEEFAEELYREHLYFLYEDKCNELSKELDKFRPFTSAYEMKKEIKRLNNIINELGKYLIEEIEDYDKHINSQYITDITREQYEGEKVCFEDTLCKLQELKGDDKNDKS